MVDIQSATDEIRRGKKERYEQEKDVMSASATQGGDNEVLTPIPKVDTRV